MTTDQILKEKLDFEDRLKEFKKIRQKNISLQKIENGEDINWEEIHQDAAELEVRNSQVLTAKELVEQEYPETVWVVKDLIPSVGFTAITGAPYSYKSFITQHLALCVALESPLFGQFEVKQGAVLLIDKENSKVLIKDRLLKLGFKDDPPVFFLNEPDKYDLSKPETLVWTLSFIKEKNIKLIILDSFVHIHRGDENDSQTIAKTFEMLKQIPVPIVFIHHHRKTIRFFTGTVLESIRGSSDIGAELEAHIAVDTMTNGALRITQGKNRWGQLIKPFTVLPILTEETAKFEYQGEIEEETTKVEYAMLAIKEVLGTQIGQEMKRKSLIENLSDGFSRVTIDRALKKMEEEKQLATFFIGKFKYLKLTSEILTSTEDFYTKQADSLNPIDSSIDV